MYTLEVDSTRRCAGDLMRVAQSLVSVTQALNNTKVIGVMDGKYAYQVDSSIRKAQSMAIKHQKQAANLSMALTQIVTKYVEADEVAKEQMTSTVEAPLLERRGNITETSKVFDGDGGYGGDQGDLKYNQSGKSFFFFWRDGENEDLYSFVKTYDGYQNYSERDIYKLFESMNTEGCGYIMLVNSIFVQFESKPDEFERIFGFPMYDENGEFNFNRLFIDLYLSTDNKYYLKESRGMQGFARDTLESYRNNPKDFVKEYGVEPFDKNGEMNADAMQAVIDRHQNEDVAELNTDWTNQDTVPNRFMHYLNEKGVNGSCDLHQNMTPRDVRRELDRGKCVNIGTAQFNLYDENGNCVRRDVGGHGMTITGVTDDGNYIVSSWGSKYLIHPDELNAPTYIVVDID